MKNTALLIILFIAGPIQAQQHSNSNMFHQNSSYFNPAAVNLTDYRHRLNFHARDQWNGVAGAPHTYWINYGVQINDKIAVGLDMDYDAIGFLDIYQSKVNFSYGIQLKEKMMLRFGAGVGFSWMQLDGTQWITPEVPPEDDPALNVSVVNQTKPIFNFGMQFSHFSGLEVGTGLLYLNRPSYNELGYQQEIHFNSNVSYIFEVKKDKFTLRPELLFMMGGSGFTFTVNTFAQVNERWNFWLGYRLQDAVMIGVGARIWKELSFNYTYDITISALNQYSNGSHEIALTWMFGKKIR